MLRYLDLTIDLLLTPRTDINVKNSCQIFKRSKFYYLAYRVTENANHEN